MTRIPATRPGLGLVELVVALTVLSVGVLGLAGAAVFAQRTFATADALERAADAAAAVLDSLVHEPAPQPGERAGQGAIVRWTVSRDSLAHRITAVVEVEDGGRRHRVTYHAVYAAGVAP